MKQLFCAWLVVVIGSTVVASIAQRSVPLATDAERALAPLMISEDGSTVTFRETAISGLKICVLADEHTFTRRTCFTVGDVRTGRWGLK